MKTFVPIKKEIQAEQVTKKTRVNVLGMLGDVHTRYVQPGEWIIYEPYARYPKVLSDEEFRALYEEKR